MIKPEVLLRLYTRIKSNPLKVWCSKELEISPQRDKAYMVTLERLLLVERVRYKYQVANKGYKNIKSGWRLLR